jgi:hypothetical protein
MNSKLFSIMYTAPTVIASILAQTADISSSSELDSSSFRNRGAPVGASVSSQLTQLSQPVSQEEPDQETEDRVVVAKRRKLTGTKLFKK